jgi:hypothetical protein
MVIKILVLARSRSSVESPAFYSVETVAYSLKITFNKLDSARFQLLVFLCTVC